MYLDHCATQLSSPLCIDYKNPMPYLRNTFRSYTSLCRVCHYFFIRCLADLTMTLFPRGLREAQTGRPTAVHNTDGCQLVSATPYCVTPTPTLLKSLMTWPPEPPLLKHCHPGILKEFHLPCLPCSIIISVHSRVN